MLRFPILGLPVYKETRNLLRGPSEPAQAEIGHGREVARKRPLMLTLTTSFLFDFINHFFMKGEDYGANSSNRKTSGFYTR